MSNLLQESEVGGLSGEKKEEWKIQTAASGVPFYYNIKAFLS
jgi:hypothetical protein